MNKQCYFFVSINVVTLSIMLYKIVCLNKNISDNKVLIYKVLQKFQDVNELNFSCHAAGNSLDALNRESL
jgi:hypothetical protein